MHRREEQVPRGVSPSGPAAIQERAMSAERVSPGRLPRQAPTVPAPRIDLLPDVARALAGRAAEHDRAGSFPADGIETVHRAGLLTASVAARYGGPGAGLAQTVVILRELGRGDPSVALLTAMTLFQHAGQARRESWPGELYAEALTESVTRPVLINALRVEPELGTPARGGLPATTARRVAGGWSLTGHKIFATGAEGLRWMAVWARTDEPEPRVGSFLVRSGSPGITIEPTWDHLGLRASRSDDVIFAGTPVPADEVAGLSGPASAPPPDESAMAWNALGLTALYLGVAAAARDWLAGFLAERTPTALGRPLATLPRFQSAVGEIEAALTSAGDLADGLAARADAGDQAAIRHAGMAKLAGTRAAISAVEQAVALVGNNGLTRRYPLERHYRDVLCARVHTPQDDSVVAAAGQAALGLTAPPGRKAG
jgi:alkylation response protein AidB-like acyl-CoA dehydrogenase